MTQPQGSRLPGTDRGPGDVALVLHTHLPWVVGHGTWPVGEEWLFQAWATSWYPVTDLLCRLAAEGHRQVLTLGVTPMVAAQVADRHLRDQVGTWIAGQMWRAEEQRQSGWHRPDALAALGPFHWRHHADLLAIHDHVEARGGLLATWRALVEADVIEVLGGPMTHPYLPLVDDPALVDAQLAAGLAATTRWLGRPPRGLWPPELGYRPAGPVADPTRPALAVDRQGTPTLRRSGPPVPGLEDNYARHGITHVMVDAPTLVRAAGGRDRDWTTRPDVAPARRGHPDDVVHDGVRIGDGAVVAWARDLSVAYHVWSPTAGYPTHPDYRDFHARGDFGLHPSWRVTGMDVDMWDKEVYDPDRVAAAIDGHVDHFLGVLHTVTDPRDDPVVVAAYDTELFGHWWFEGPRWLEGVLRRVHADPDLRTTTLAGRMARRPPTRRLHLPESSWGWAKGHASWATPDTRPMWRAVRDGGAALVDALRSPSATGAREDLATAVRQWSLLAASDWPFMVTRGDTADYGHDRVAGHRDALARAMAAVGRDDQSPDAAVGRDAQSPDAAGDETAAGDTGAMSTDDVDTFVAAVRAATPTPEPAAATQITLTPRPLRILELSWEYPPRVVGGLGRHVHAVATGLAAAGHDVTVATAGHPDAPAAEVRDGVRVVRTTTPPRFDLGADLVPWVLDLNLDLQARALALTRHHRFDVVHAHDWVVAPTALGLARMTGLPVVATFHATEHGRHQGHLPHDGNRWIHQVEWRLADLATRTITCSAHMASQVQDLFDVQRHDLAVIPNGVDRGRRPPAATVAAMRHHLAPGDAVLVVVTGRLEWEKGVHDLLTALSMLHARGLDQVVLAIAGAGSQRDALDAQVDALGLRDHVTFLGFLAAPRVAALQAAADVVVAPSLAEPFGMVALEAAAVGTPAVVGDTGGLAELAHDGVGMPTPPGDPVALADTIVRVLGDPVLAAGLIRQGRRALVHHDWTTIAHETATVLGAAVDDHERSATATDRVDGPGGDLRTRMAAWCATQP